MDRRTRDNQQPISAGRFHRQGAGHDHTNAYSDREPKCDTNGNCYTHCYRNRDGYTHRYCYCYCYRYCHCHCHCYGFSYRDRDSYSYGNRYTHCYCYCYCYAHCNCNRYSNANVDTDANTNSHSNRDAETYAHAAVSPFTKASSNSTSTLGEIHLTVLCRQMGMQPRRCGASDLLQYSERRLIEPWLQFQIASTQRGDYKATLL
jgi:hypothetical protein